jgi:virginiamycin B lyase
MVWYAGNRAACIGRLDPATGDIDRYPMPDDRAGDPHTLVFDGEGRIWFTVQHGTMIGRLDPSTGQVDLVEVPTPNSRPYGIVVDSTDRPWVVEFAGGKVATVDPETLELREYELPRPEARPRRVGLTSDQGVWFVDFAGGFLGRLDPGTGAVEEIPLPGGSRSQPYGMVVDRNDRIWLVETGVSPNRFVGYDTRSSEFVGEADIPSGGGSVRHMYYDEDQEVVWFGTDANTIGRATLP